MKKKLSGSSKVTKQVRGWNFTEKCFSYSFTHILYGKNNCPDYILNNWKKLYLEIKPTTALISILTYLLYDLGQYLGQHMGIKI